VQVECQLSAARVRYDTHVAETEDKLQLMLQTVEKLELENSELRTRVEEEKRFVGCVHSVFSVWCAVQVTSAFFRCSNAGKR
jgi:hypothetical protein